MDETRSAAGMAEVREVLKDWDLVTDELAARSIATDSAWAVLQLVAHNRMAAALERLTGIQGGRLNRDTLGDTYNVQPRPAPTGAMNTASLALVYEARELVRGQRPGTRLHRVEVLLTRALGDGVEPDEDPRR